MSRTRYRFGEDHYPHFMTATIVAWLPVFSYPWFVEVIRNSWRFLQTKRDINILAFVIMENHLHWIAVGPQLSKRVGEFKSFTATAIIKDAASVSSAQSRAASRRWRLPVGLTTESSRTYCPSADLEITPVIPISVAAMSSLLLPKVWATRRSITSGLGH